ncbi:MAG TPA: type III-A CRISPR-associated RAMP protein Csm4 [Saprospiraceae bacterium]|nr:type III-A CRISPR-associated RAMP protein Csm4 [Saprospiraceae bacterium]
MKTHSFDIIKLHFTSALHLSSGKEGDYDSSLKVLHSDTLKSAIFACAVELFGDDITTEPEENNPFMDSFRVSSAFPFCGQHCFLPKTAHPEGFIFRNSKGEIDRKAWKRVEFMDSDYFNRLLQSDNKEDADRTHLSEKGDMFGSMFAGRGGKPFMESEVQQRVSVLRHATTPEADAQPYYLDRIFFEKGSGMYFALEWNDRSFETSVQAAINLLGDNGIGTDRNTGSGHFEPEFGQQLELVAASDATHYLNLSLYCPMKEEVKEAVMSNSSYRDLLKRGGWWASPTDANYMSFRKKSVYMFGEGALFGAAGTMPKGQLVNLRPEEAPDKTPVYRDGRAVFLPVALKTI